MQNETQVSMEKIKESHKVVLNHYYSVLINYVNSLNISQIYKSHAFMNLDQGIYWLEQGINSSNPLPAMPVPPMPVPPMDIQSLVKDGQLQGLEIDEPIEQTSPIPDKLVSPNT